MLNVKGYIATAPKGETREAILRSTPGSPLMPPAPPLPPGMVAAASQQHVGTCGCINCLDPWYYMLQGKPESSHH